MGSKYFENRDPQGKVISRSEVKEKVISGKFVETRDFSGKVVSTSTEKYVIGIISKYFLVFVAFVAAERSSAYFRYYSLLK